MTIDSEILWFVINALAVHRLSRLVVADTILDTPRRWLLTRWPGDDTEYLVDMVDRVDGIWVNTEGVEVLDAGDGTWIAATPRWIGRWVECVWCVSIWVSVPIVWLAHTSPGWWGYVATGLAFSTIAGWVHTTTND